MDFVHTSHLILIHCNHYTGSHLLLVLCAEYLKVTDLIIILARSTVVCTLNLFSIDFDRTSMLQLTKNHPKQYGVSEITKKCGGKLVERIFPTKTYSITGGILMMMSDPIVHRYTEQRIIS